jgi:uncharacterized damage-inducible protein DinB
MDSKTIEWLYGYNLWANTRSLGAASALTPEQFVHDLHNSFGSVRDTLAHILGAEWVWLERWKGISPKTLLNAADFPTADALKARWDVVERERVEFIRALTPERLAGTLHYSNLKGDSLSAPLWKAMVHLVNHSTYHRGQVTTLLRQLGAKPVSTDFINFNPA